MDQLIQTVRKLFIVTLPVMMMQESKLDSRLSIRDVMPNHSWHQMVLLIQTNSYDLEVSQKANKVVEYLLTHVFNK